MGKVFWVVLIAISSVFSSKAQQVLDSIRSITVEDGLPQGWVFDMVQDKRGFIWLAANGLYRYDGKNFKNFSPSFQKTNAWPVAGELRRLLLDNQDNLWLTYSTGIVIQVNTVTGQMRNVVQEKAFAWLKHPTSSYYIVYKANQYFATSPDSLIRFNPVSGSHITIPLPPGELLVGVGSSHSNELFVSTSKGFYHLQKDILQKIIQYPNLVSLEQPFQDSLIRFRFRPFGQIVETSNNQLLVAALGGIYRYHLVNHSATYQPIKGYANRIYEFVAARNGMAYFIQNGNLSRMDANGHISSFTGNPKMPLFYPLLEDRSGIFWSATTNATGLCLFRPRPPNFHSFPYKNGFSHDVMEPWLHNPMQGVDYGSYGFRYANDPLGNGWVITNVVKPQGKFTTDVSYVYALGKAGVRQVDFGAAIQPLAISFTPYGQCWMVIKKDGQRYLTKANTHTGTCDIVSPLSFPTENGFLTVAGNRLVISLPDTLLLLDTATLARRIFSKEQLGSETALLMAVSDPGDNRIVWIATKGSGMIHLNLTTGKMVRYSESNGLPNNTVYMIVPDKKGFLWCSSNKGIFRFDPANGTSVSFTAKDGLQGNEFNRYHFLEMPDGRFVFGGTNGYSVFHPDSVQADSFVPPVIISEVLVNNEPLNQAVPAYTGKIVSSLPEIRLMYDQNFLTFTFSGLEYNAPDKLHYRYMLEGFDKSWTTTGTEASAKYTSIPPGRYVFKVKSSNSSGIWNNEQTSITLIISPPWWKTGWAYALYVLLTGGILFAFYHNWLHRTRARQQIILNQKEAEQLKVIDDIKNRFFSNITHEFRTPLTLILAPLEEVQHSDAPSAIKQKLNGIERNARRLLQLINQLLDLAKLEASSMPLELSRGNPVYFVQDIAEQFMPQALAKYLSLTFQVVPQEMTYLFDRDKLQKIVQNLLSNALKFTPTGGNVKLQTSVQQTGEKQKLEIIVQDTGIGIPPEKIPFIFNRFYQADSDATNKYAGTGIGLALVKELIELMGGRIEVNSSSTVSGTSFTVEIPITPAPQPINTGGAVSETSIGNSVIAPYEHLSPGEMGSVDAREDKPLILVTEDDAELNAFIANTFRPQYRVLTATNGKTGLEIARRELPDLIISDARMPELDGYRFCRAIKEHVDTNHIAFILLTAKSALHSITEGLLSQADDYITKPFVVSQLQLRVSNLLNRQQTLRTYFSRQFSLPDKPLEETKAEHPFMLQLYDFIQQHLDDPDLTVATMAAAVSVSQRTLVRKLTTLAGIAPVELIKQYRLKKAAEFLLAGDTVAEAAYKVGFETATYFSTSFKNFYNITPTEFVKKNR